MNILPAVIPNSSDVSGWLMLIDAVQQLSGARTLEDVIAIVRRAARRIAQADGATFVLRDDDRCHYVDEDAIGPLWKGQKFSMKACISGWAMLNRRTAEVPDIYLDPRIPHDAYRPTFVRSLIMVPVRVNDPLAAIGIYWASERSFIREEVERLESLARATATAIANVTLQASLSGAAASALAQAAEIQGLLGKVRDDAAERLHIEEQLHRAQRMEAIGNLTGGLAHDFNNLLSVIVGNLEYLLDQPGIGTEARELAGRSLEAAVLGADLTRSLLAFARRRPQQAQRIDVNAVIGPLMQMLRRTIGAAIEPELRLDPAPWPVAADPALLESAIANLANNARDAMPRGGRITVTTRNVVLAADDRPGTAPGDYVAIEFADTGTGMVPEVQKRIFEPFFTTKPEGEGSGLGLAMVFGFVRQSGGSVWAESAPGQGTVFHLLLPRDRSATAPAGKPAGRAVPGGGETVLVVEDNDGIRTAVARQLRAAGYQVLEASDAAAAQAHLASGTVRLLFTDIVLRGGTGGVELARQARRNCPGLRLLFTSGFPDTKGGEEAVALSAVGVLGKPYRKAELLRVVRAALDAPNGA